MTSLGICLDIFISYNFMFEIYRFWNCLLVLYNLVYRMGTWNKICSNKLKGIKGE